MNGGGRTELYMNNEPIKSCSYLQVINIFVPTQQKIILIPPAQCTGTLLHLFAMISPQSRVFLSSIR